MAKLFAVMALLLTVIQATAQTDPQTRTAGNIALDNGQLFDGTGFQRRSVYSVDGRFTFTKPARIDRTIDLGGTWVVPPFGEAHNHNLNGHSEDRSRQALQRYLADGVFYVKIPGNYPFGDEMRRRLPMNRPGGPDVALAQTFLTASGGHPILLHEEILLPQGFHAGVTKDQLRDALYFTIDSESELDEKWPAILALRPDFIKANLWYADEFEQRKDDPRFIGKRGLDPRILAMIVHKAHADQLRVSVHIANAADFRLAVAAGADEIVHSFSPSFFTSLDDRLAEVMTNRIDPETFARLVAEGAENAQDGTGTYTPISREDAILAAARGIPVVTTIGLASRSSPLVQEALKPVLAANLKRLHDSGVTLAVGSDMPFDTSAGEFATLRWTGAFDNLTLLKMWTGNTPRAIFPDRRIGAIEEGYEASFLALEGDPLENLDNVRRIKLRFKQGTLLEAGAQ
jgi:imidazolonepropionase-like amidohydrolase